MTSESSDSGLNGVIRAIQNALIELGKEMSQSRSPIC